MHLVKFSVHNERGHFKNNLVVVLMSTRAFRCCCCGENLHSCLFFSPTSSALKQGNDSVYMFVCYSSSFTQQIIIQAYEVWQ